VALCGVNRHPDGAWATLAIAEHPSGLVRSCAAPGAHASAERFEVTVPKYLEAGERSLRVDIDDMHLDVTLDELVGWPLRLGGGGLLSLLPFLRQYWHPHVLGGRTTGHLVIDDEQCDLDGADVYAEKNWGAGFPDRWWWGQAQGFADRPLCVAFGGGRLAAGPLGSSVTGCMVRLGDHVVRFAPPISTVRTYIGDGRWAIRARRPRWTLTVEADGNGHVPAVLPVPLLAERRNAERDLEHLEGRLWLRVVHRGSPVFDGESQWAGLEVGAASAAEASALATEVGVPPTAIT
jgi:tocopherol cyclase